MALKRCSQRVEIEHRRRIPDGIVMRTKSGARAHYIRELACGHTQVEPPGGDSHEALDARCYTCYPVESKS